MVNAHLFKAHPDIESSTRASVSTSNYLKWAVGLTGSVLDVTMMQPSLLRDALQKVSHRGSNSVSSQRCFVPQDFQLAPSRCSIKKSDRYRRLSVKEKIEAVYKVLVEHRYQGEVAKDYHVNRRTINSLCMKA